MSEAFCSQALCSPCLHSWLYMRSMLTWYLVNIYSFSAVGHKAELMTFWTVFIEGHIDTSWSDEHFRRHFLTYLQNMWIYCNEIYHIYRLPCLHQIRWQSGIAVARWCWSTKLTYVGPGWYWDGWTCPGSVSSAEHLFWYVTSHLGWGLPSLRGQ